VAGKSAPTTTLGGSLTTATGKWISLELDKAGVEDLIDGRRGNSGAEDVLSEKYQAEPDLYHLVPFDVDTRHWATIRRPDLYLTER